MSKARWLVGGLALLLLALGGIVLGVPRTPPGPAVVPRPAAGSVPPSVFAPPSAAPAAARRHADARLTGRCVDEQGAPIAGALVSAEVAEVRTDAAGRFALPADQGTVRIVLAAPGHVARRVEVEGKGDAGTFALRRGVVLSGRLVDERGEGRPGAVVRLQDLDAGVDPRGGAADEVWPDAAVTGPAGGFEWARPLPPGSWRVRVERAPALVGTRTVRLEGHRVHVDLRCAAAGNAISGTVRGVDGAPAAGALVWAQVAESRSGAMASGPGSDAGTRRDATDATDPEGRFRLFRPRGAAPDQPVALFAALPGGGEPMGPVAVAWGASAVDLRLPGAAELVLRVVDGATGAPLTGFEVQCAAIDGIDEPTSPRPVEADAAGQIVLGGLGAGRHSVVVHPDDPAWLPNLPHTFDANERLVTVALQRAVRCPVRVVDEAGVPVAGVRIELQTAVPEAAAGPVVDLRHALDQGGWRGERALRLAVAISGDDGRAALRWHAGVWRVRLSGPEVAPTLLDGVALEPTAAATLRVRRAGEVVGSIATPGHVGPVRVRLLGGGDGVHPPDSVGPVLANEGAFTIGGVPAGRWHVQLELPATQGSADWAPLGRSVPVDVRSGASVRVDLRCAAPATGGVAGTAFVDGRPAQEVVLRIGGLGENGFRAVATRSCVPDSQGRFAFEGLLPRAMELALRLPCGGATADARVGDVMVPDAGERLWRELSLTTAEVVLRVGRASPTRRLELRGERGAWVLFADGEGVARLEGVPVGRYRLWGFEGRGLRDLGVLDVGVSGVDRAIEVR